MGTVLVWIANVIIPGAGLIIRRREWLGLLLALLFSICANVAVAGFLIAPESMPAWAPWTAATLTALTWTFAQFLCAWQARSMREAARRIAALLETSRGAISLGDMDAARKAILSAASIDEEDVELNVLWAQVSQRSGDLHEARYRWRRVIQLDVRRRYREEALTAMSTIEDQA